MAMAKEKLHMSNNAITEAVVECLKNGVTDNEAIAKFIREHVPGAQTTAASVSSTKSRLRKEGHDVPAKRPASSFGNGEVDWEAFKTPEQLPDHDPSETIEDATKRIAVRYDALERMAARL